MMNLHAELYILIGYLHGYISFNQKIKIEIRLKNKFIWYQIFFYGDSFSKITKKINYTINRK